MRLTVASDDRLGRLQGDPDLAEDVGGERGGHAEHAEQDVLVAEQLPPSAWPSACASAIFARGATPRQPARVCSSAPGPNVASRRSWTASKSIPSVARAVGIDPGRAGGDTRPERLLDRLRADAKLLQRQVRRSEGSEIAVYRFRDGEIAQVWFYCDGYEPEAFSAVFRYD